MPQKRQIRAPISASIQPLESLPQAIVAHGRDLAPGEQIAFHRHRRAQLVYASRGVMTVTTRTAAYVVPPQRAVWMPSDVEHRIDAREPVRMRTLYLEPDAAIDMPTEVCVMQVTPLLRELVIEAVRQGPDYAPDSPAARLMPVIADQIRAQPVTSLALPLPRDARLRKITGALLEDPADARGLDAWAEAVGASKRTLVRLFPRETGMSFREWRQQCRLLRAVELLNQGERVTQVALETGYDNTSAFISMFRRCLGTTPTAYRSGAASD